MNLSTYHAINYHFSKKGYKMSLFNFLNDNDSIKIKLYDDIINYLNLNKVLESELWELAKEFDEFPNITNLVYSLQLERIELFLSEKYPLLNTSSFINASDAHFYIDGEEIYDLVLFRELIENYYSLSA